MKANGVKNEKIESLPIPDDLLSNYFLNAHRQSGEEYEPSCSGHWQRRRGCPFWSRRIWRLRSKCAPKSCVVIFIPTLRFQRKGNISQAIPYSLPPLQFIVVQTKDRSAGAHKNERKRRIVIEGDEDDWVWQAIFCQLCPIWISQLQTFTWLWLIMFCKACKKILFDLQKTLSRILESTIVSVRFRYKRLHIQ